MEFIDYVAHAKNYNEKIGYDAYQISSFINFWTVVVMIGLFFGLVVNIASMKLYYNMAVRQSTLLQDRLNAMNAAILKLLYICFQFFLTLIGDVAIRKAN